MRREVIGNCELSCEDCMELMARYPDGYFDLAIADPPYGVGSITYMPAKRNKTVGGFIDEYNILVATMDMNQRNNVKIDIVHGSCSKNTIKKFGVGDTNVAPGPEYFKELFRVSKNQIICGGNYFLLPPSRGFVIWDKGRGENFSMAMCEYLWVSFNTNAKIFKCKSEQPASSGDPRIHPTQKPVALYKWLLSKYAKPGWKILDTHMGSGSIAIACYDMGFPLTACEIDGDYFTAAVERLRKFAAQGTLDFGGGE